MLCLAGVPEVDINHNQCAMAMNTQDNSLLRTQSVPPRGDWKIMIPSHEDRQYIENKISTRDNWRATFTQRRVMSMCRKRYRRNTTSNFQQHRKPGSKATLRTIHIMGSLSRKSVQNDDSVILPEAKLCVYLNKQQGQQGNNMNTSVPSVKSMESTFNDIAQIGGREEVRPSPRRGVGVGNKSTSVCQSLTEIRESIGMEERVLSIDQLVEVNIPIGTTMRQTTLGRWCTTTPNNIDTQHKDSTQLSSTGFTRLEIDKVERSQDDTLANIRKKQAEGVTEANSSSPPSRSPSQRLGAEDIVSFEYINGNGINAHANFVELSNAMGILENMEAGVYSVVKTQWDTTCPKFFKFVR